LTIYEIHHILPPMQTTDFTLEGLRGEVRAICRVKGWSMTRLARASGVDQASLSRFLSGSAGLKGDSIEKLWPFVFGECRPRENGENGAATGGNCPASPEA
jgi:lambda repressor-like predicted transcriptional regulator